MHASVCPVCERLQSSGCLIVAVGLHWTALDRRVLLTCSCRAVGCDRERPVVLHSLGRPVWSVASVSACRLCVSRIRACCPSHGTNSSISNDDCETESAKRAATGSRAMLCHWCLMPRPPVCPPRSRPLAPHTLPMHKAALMVLAVVVATTSMDPSIQDGQAGCIHCSAELRHTSKSSSSIQHSPLCLAALCGVHAMSEQPASSLSDSHAINGQTRSLLVAGQLRCIDNNQAHCHSHTDRQTDGSLARL
ncbi:hypothetical protein BC831DRAFT_80090 [Entophlyctis helioformis]|nr:hypothetical protein BC831DRAFT_80090 [Entophlyctis helioformis]